PVITRSPTATGIKLIQLSSDPYTDPASQHQTEVEPGSYAFGTTIVAAFQAGRFSDVGSSNIGWATSTDGGMTWQHGFLPGTTSQFYGNCYAEWDNYAKGNLIQMSTSHDGGSTWETSKTTADYAVGTSGYPLVQPNGTVIVPISNANQTAIIVFASKNGGVSW